MNNKIASVKSVEYITTEYPNMSCGTGYSQPSKYKFTYDDDSSEIIKIDTWYVPNNLLRKAFNDGVLMCSSVGIDNPHRAFEMFLEEGVKNNLFNIDISYLK